MDVTTDWSTVWRIPPQSRGFNPLQRPFTCQLTSLFVQVNVGIHVLCVPPILLTAFLLVRPGNTHARRSAYAFVAHQHSRRPAALMAVDT